MLAPIAWFRCARPACIVDGLLLYPNRSWMRTVMAVVGVADREKNDSLQGYYDEHGYVVARKLIPEERIKRLLAVYARDIVPSRQRFFRQDSRRYERNSINEHGYVRQSFL